MHNHSFKNIFVNSMAATLNIILLLIIFEVVFYFFEIRPTLNGVLNNYSKNTAGYEVNATKIANNLCNKLEMMDFDKLKTMFGSQELMLELLKFELMKLDIPNDLKSKLSEKGITLDKIKELMANHDVNIDEMIAALSINTDIFDNIKSDCAETIKNSDTFDKIYNHIIETKVEVDKATEERNIERNANLSRRTSIHVFILIFAFAMVTIFFQLMYKKAIDFTKIKYIVGISYGTIIVLELLLFFIVYKHIKPEDMKSVFSKLIGYVKDTL